MPDDKVIEEEIDMRVELDAEPLSADGNDKAAPERPSDTVQGADLEKKGLLPGASLEVAPGIALGDKVEHGGEQWTAKGSQDGKAILFQAGRGAGYQGEFRILDGKPDANLYKELPRFEGQPKDTTYYSDKTGEVYKVTKQDDGKSLMSTAEDVKLVEPVEIAAGNEKTEFVSADNTEDKEEKPAEDKKGEPKGEAAKPQEAAKPGDEVDLKGEKMKLATYIDEQALLYKKGRGANDAVEGVNVSEQELKSKYQEVKVEVDGKQETRYIEKGHPEKGVFKLTDFGGQKTLYPDGDFALTPKSELKAPEKPAEGRGDAPVKPVDPVEKLDLERIKKIAKAFSEQTREVPITREQFESIFKNFNEADRKLALEIMEQSAPNMTPRALDEQMRNLQNQLEKMDPSLRKEGVTVFVLKGDDSGSMMAQLLRKNQDQLKVNVVELDAAGLKALEGKVPESAVVLGDPSKANAAQRELLASVKKLYVSDVNGFDRGLNLIDFGASQFAGPKAMEEKMASLVDQAKALQAADKTLSNEEAVRRVMQGDTAKSATEINPNAKVITPEAPLAGRDLRNQVGGAAEYRINSMYEQFTAPQMTPKQVEQFLASIGNKEIQALTGQILERGGVQYNSYTTMMKEFKDLHSKMMAQLPPGTKPADVLIVSGLEQHGQLRAGKQIDNSGSQLVAGKLYAAANGLGPENFITAKELAARGPGAANDKILLYVDDFALSGRQAAGVMNANAEMLKASGGKVVVATIGNYETKVNPWALWQTDKRYSELKGFDVTVLSNHTYKPFYAPEYLESLGLKGRETQLGRFNMFKPGHDSGIATYLLTPYGGPNNNLQMLDDMQKSTGLRGRGQYKHKFDPTDALKENPTALPPKAETKPPPRQVPTAEGLTGTDTRVNPDGTLDRQEARPGEALARKQLEDRKQVDAREIESMKRSAEELAKSDNQADKEKAAAMKKTIDALEGRLGKEAQEVAHREVLKESRNALEKGEGGGYGRAVVGGLIGVGILASAALAYYHSTLKAEEQKALERARVK